MDKLPKKILVKIKSKKYFKSVYKNHCHSDIEYMEMYIGKKLLLTFDDKACIYYDEFGMYWDIDFYNIIPSRLVKILYED